MSKLAEWLRRELKRRGLAQNVAAVHAGVGQATISDILNKGHIPKVETLFRLADYFGTSREEVLRLAGHLPPAAHQAEPGGEEEALIGELIAEFRQVPDEWKEMAVQQVAQFRRLAELRPLRIIGEEEEEAQSGQGESREATDEESQAA